MHDDGRVIDWLGPVDLSELKAEKTFKEERGRESLSENHTFVLWLDNSNPKLVVLSMVRKIPEGDVTKSCYRFVVQIQDGDSLATPPAVVAQAADARPDQPPPPSTWTARPPHLDLRATALDGVVGLATMVYHDSNMDCTRTEIDRFAMASKTPDEAWGKRPRTTGERLILAGGRAERQQNGPGGRAKIRKVGSRKVSAPSRAGAEYWAPAAPTDVGERVDAAAELVKLLCGNQEAGLALEKGSRSLLAGFAVGTGGQCASPMAQQLLGHVVQQAVVSSSEPAIVNMGGATGSALSGPESFHQSQPVPFHDALILEARNAAFSGGATWAATAAAENSGGGLGAAASVPSHIYERPRVSSDIYAARTERLGGSAGGCERIMAERGWAHTRELMVRWRQGADEVPVEDSWEPFDALCAEPGARQAVGAWEMLRQHQHQHQQQHQQQQQPQLQPQLQPQQQQAQQAHAAGGGGGGMLQSWGSREVDRAQVAAQVKSQHLSGNSLAGGLSGVL